MVTVGRPLLLDLYCGAGGAAFGYVQAGFDVIGVDIVPQPHYPFEFVCADALEYLESRSSYIADEFVAVHASPPCQAHSILGSIWRSDNSYGYDERHDDLIGKTRDLIIATGLPYVIENVTGAADQMKSPAMLCGTMFGLRLFRHRLFETSFLLFTPWHVSHEDQGLTAPKTSRQPGDGEVWSIYGHFSGVDGAKEAMGIDWMTRDELAQAIPPAYTKYIGQQMIRTANNGK